MKTLFAPLAIALTAASPALAGTIVFSSSKTGPATYAVTQSGTYLITASGADGGDGSAGAGGLGAILSDDFALSAGENLSILIGGAGSNSSFYSGGGGGGGTFVADGTVPLLVAGGGSGGSFYAGGGAASALEMSPSGTAGLSTELSSGGGGGFYQSADYHGGQSFLAGGAGGAGVGCCGAKGGIGGGGGASNFGGGGGGYDGGDGAGSGGVGGSSFDGGLQGPDASAAVLGEPVNGGDGEVTITLLSADPASPVSAPSEWSVLVGAGLLAARRRRG